MYAETYIHEIGLENKSLLEIEEYIESVIASYPHNNLMPSFFVAEWQIPICRTVKAGVFTPAFIVLKL